MIKNPYLIFLGLALIFISLERLFPLRKTQKILRQGVLTDLAYFISNKYLNQVGHLVLIALVVPAFYSLGPSQSSLIAKTATPLWLEIPYILILTDFLVYWAHRLTHQIPFLWKFHAVHHSTKEMDWLAAFRLHFLDQIFTKAVSMVPIFLLGFSTTAIEINIIFITIHAAFNHSNLNIRLPFIRYFICTPEFHRWHHATDPQYANKNFSGSFSIFDFIFGTGIPFTKPTPDALGLNEPFPESFLAQLKYPFQEGWLALKNKKKTRTPLEDLPQNEPC